MTQTNTDYLLQVTTPVADRTYGAAVQRRRLGPVRRPSEPGVDVLWRRLSQLWQQFATNRRGSLDVTTGRGTAAFKPSSHDSANSSSSQTSPSNQDDAE